MQRSGSVHWGGDRVSQERKIEKQKKGTGMQGSVEGEIVSQERKIGKWKRGIGMQRSGSVEGEIVSQARKIGKQKWVGM